MIFVMVKQVKLPQPVKILPETKLKDSSSKLASECRLEQAGVTELLGLFQPQCKNFMILSRRIQLCCSEGAKLQRLKI